MKFKVKKQDWYTIFGSNLLGSTPEEHYEYEVKAQKKEGRNYDGPLRYIEECDPMPFPPREGIMYCVRVHRKPESYYYKYYQCYCYQLGKWWKYKKEETIFTDLYVPQLLSHYDWVKIRRRGIRRFLSKKALNDYEFHTRIAEHKAIRRDIHKSMIEFIRERRNEKESID